MQACHHVLGSGGADGQALIWAGVFHVHLAWPQIPRVLFLSPPPLIRRLDSGVSSALFDAFRSDSTYHMNAISACTLLPCSLLQFTA